MITFGKCSQPALLIHGGAGPMDPSASGIQNATQILRNIATKVLIDSKKDNLLHYIVEALTEMENHPDFNAGLGSALQQDAAIRTTAAIMRGSSRSFSGVIGLTHVKNPSILAAHLQTADARVLTHPGCEFLARELQLPFDSLLTSKRVEQWQKRLSCETPRNDCDTVGAIYWDGKRELIAGTSTGGKGLEYPGRVSDSGTVAGNYSNEYCATVATGIGEEIVDDALCAKIVTRVSDGMSLADACQRTYQEGQRYNRSYGWLSVTADGEWCVAHTSPAMSYFGLTEDNKSFVSS